MVSSGTDASSAMMENDGTFHPERRRKQDVKIPKKLLARVAGPLVAGAALSCTSAPATDTAPITPIDPATEAPHAEAPDPVPYDATAEADRIARTEALLASRDVAREARIDAQEEAQHRRQAAQIRITHRFIGIGCGRG